MKTSLVIFKPVQINNVDG